MVSNKYQTKLSGQCVQILFHDAKIEELVNGFMFNLK
jgi:hypothetical protein